MLLQFAIIQNNKENTKQTIDENNDSAKTEHPTVIANNKSTNITNKIRLTLFL